MGKINAGEAPEGYITINDKGRACEGCAFDGTSCWSNDLLLGVSCTGVIFVAETSAPATLLHPMGSMGEEVEA